MATTPKVGDRALQRARAGDGDALALMWRTYQPTLLRYVRGRGLDDPESVTSQIWIDVARNLRGFRGGVDEFRRWLFTIARRRVIDELRYQARRVRTSPLDDHDDRLASASPGAEQVADDRDAITRALALVRQLPDPMRDAVLLRVVAGLSVEDAARVMDVAPGYVPVLVHRGLRRLEQILDGERRQGAVMVTSSRAIKGLS